MPMCFFTVFTIVSDFHLHGGGCRFVSNADLGVKTTHCSQSTRPKCHSQRNDENTQFGECLLPFSSVFPTTNNLKMKVQRTTFSCCFIQVLRQYLMTKGREIDRESFTTDYSGGHTDLTGRRIKQSHKELRNFYCLSYIIMTIKTRSMRWVVYIAGTYKNSGRKTPL